VASYLGDFQEVFREEKTIHLKISSGISNGGRGSQVNSLYGCGLNNFKVNFTEFGLAEYRRELWP
jgi:hypothetical protein